MRITAAVVLALVIGGHESAAAGGGVQGWDDPFLTVLDTDCGPVGRRSFVDGDPAYGVTRERVNVVLEARLRSAGIYGTAPWTVPPDDDVTPAAQMARRNTPHLVVMVWFSGPAVFVEASFERALLGPAAGRMAIASTWSHRKLGGHGSDGNGVMQAVSELVDLFVLEYLRVNDAACRRRGRR